jgi:dephospho-CoA kinase
MVEHERQKVVGISGQISAGKTTAGTYLKENGYHYARFSSVLADLLKEKGIEPSRTALQKLGEEVNKNPGQIWLCEQLIQRLPTEGNIVIDGLRFPEDHFFMAHSYGDAFTHLHVQASIDLRAKRYISNEGSSLEFFEAIKHPVECSIESLANLAHVRILNESDLNKFYFLVKSAISIEDV